MIPIGDMPGQRRSFPFFTVLLLAANILAFVYQLSLPSDELRRLFFMAGVIPLEYTAGEVVGAPPPAGIVYLTLVTSMFQLVGPEEAGIAFWAHVGGFVGGLVLVLLLPRRRKNVEGL